jgi:E3 ubiquitin-protein ligase HUWE1
MLLQNCGNRSIYASSSHLNSLLNTTSLSLLEATLLLGSELAQRYQAALKRMTSPAKKDVTTALLANHYNIDLDRVLYLALPFTKTVTSTIEAAQPTTPATPSVKGKEKANFNLPLPSQKSSTTTIYANDIVSMVKGGSGVSSSPRSIRSGVESVSTFEKSWEEWGDVKIIYYPKSTSGTDLSSNTPSSVQAIPPIVPATPTPIRRSSNLGPHGQRANRQLTSDDSPTHLARSSTIPTEDLHRMNFMAIEIPSLKLKSVGVHDLLREHVSVLPKHLQYELLTKLRVADALTSSLETRRQILAVRFLAITNLAYIHPDLVFKEKVLKQDEDEPRQLQLAYQLAELVHPPADGDVAVPRYLQTLAFSALDALSQHQSKFQHVCAALNTNVNHGVLLYVVRKAVAEMNTEDIGDKVTEDDEWRDALFSLLSNLSLTPRTGGDLVTAGLIPILVEVLSLRTLTAERYHPKVLSFLDNIMYSARDAFQTLVSADGLDAVSDLIVFEAKTASENAASGKGMRPEYRSAAVDYDIPYFQQQTLKWLFKFIHHMMSTAGGYGGNFDRLLRNLIDSSQLLGSLRQIIGNANCFGSVVWTNSVSILNDFINNEPTSFAVIAEAGLSRGFLEAVTNTTITMPSDLKKTESQPEQVAEQVTDGGSSSPPSDDADSDDEVEIPHRPTLTMLQTPREGPLARGIMPTSETINIVPQAFGAICLNSTGMKMFQASKALDSFFQIFESSEHVKCMESNKDLPTSLGSTFDELVRHHPPLKTAIMNAIVDMVARVGYLCKTKAEKDKIGAKLWIAGPSGKPIIADEQIKTSAHKSPKGKGKAVYDGNDIEMRDADAEVADATTAHPSADLGSNTSMTPYITAVATFLLAMFSNSAVRNDFSVKGGVEYVLDLADSPCLAYDYQSGSASHNLQQVISLLAEQKPHLAIPSLLKRAQAAGDTLAPFASHEGRTIDMAFFAPFVNPENQRLASVELLAKGTSFAKALVNIHSLISSLNTCFQATPYSHRISTTSFNQLNVADYYVRLVHCLGPLLGTSLREEIQLQKFVPDHWKTASRVKDSGFGEPIADAILLAEPPSPAQEIADVEAQSSDQPLPSMNGDLPVPATNSSATLADKKPISPSKAEQDSAHFKNFQILKYLLSKMSRTISPFFQTLGKALVTKRNPESFQKQSHASIADALAETILQQLSPPAQESTIENYSYWIGILHVLKDMLIDVSRHNERPIQTITLVLQAFKDKGGFDSVNHILEVFTSEIRSSNLLQSGSESDKSTEEFLKFELAVAGTKNILTLYNQIVSGKNVTESLQTLSMTTRTERDRSRPEHFSPPQFLVELRMAVLPVVRRLWESDLVEKAPSQISEKLIEVIRTIANADSEANALKRSDKAGPLVKAPRKHLKINSEHLSTLIDNSYDDNLANEALYRCNNSFISALEYCREAREVEGRRYPVPEGDIAPNSETNGSFGPRTNASTGTATPDDHAMAIDSLPDVSVIIDTFNQQMPPPPAPGSEPVTTPQNFDPIISGYESRNNNSSNSSSSVPRASPSSAAPQPSPSAGIEAQAKLITVDDLNEERAAIRDNLIDRCLDVINAHGEVTFEVADLIATVVGKSSDPPAQRKTIGETLVIALMSFAGEDDPRTSGKKIAAYAHLLALLLRDKLFYDAAVGELKENLGTLLNFIKLSPSHSSEEPSPWIAHILLIVEMLLSEDTRPRKTKWTAPKDENDTIEKPVLQPIELAVPPEDQFRLLEAILDILPRIGKDESLALAVLRILVILTRTRSMAQAMGEKKNIQRLFVMAKQLAGASSMRIQSPLMLILRHVIEDDATIKQIMRSEVRAFFDNNRQQRNVDQSFYLRGLSHTAVRAPELFVEVTNELVEFNRWTFPSSDPPSRHITLRLKESNVAGIDSSKSPDDSVQPTVQATEGLSIEDVKPSTEGGDIEMLDGSKSVAPELRLPVVENPDGIIHFLLCELLNYKDVEDKDPAVAAASATDKGMTPSNSDITMTGTPLTPDLNLSKDAKSSKTSGKQEFKAEDHPIFIYRCFILQCLTELLSCYNRTKIEFINFKRSAPPQPMTPSKPRSSVVNYLLFDLIPMGTLDDAETITLQKKKVTSEWADSVLSALLCKTGEQKFDRSREQTDGEDELDLLFVRRFVLENILKAYKEASASSEPLDVKYARMLQLAELMHNIMKGKPNVGGWDTHISKASLKQLRRIMFEKGYIAALTASLADIDLNFPGAKRAVESILKPLQILTEIAINLNDKQLISAAPGQADEEEIESATSVSDLEDEREETPDLFRNSTLGMFEPGREEDSSSESEDGRFSISSLIYRSHTNCIR